MIRSVAVPVIDEFAMFEFGVVCEVFGLDRSYAGLEPFDFRVCSLQPGTPVDNAQGVRLLAPYGLEAMEDADPIARNMVVPPQRDGGQRQYIERPVPDCTDDTFSELIVYHSGNLPENHSVSALAQRTHM